MQRPQGFENDQVPALHVSDTLAADPITLAFPLLDRAVQFEHGIEMANEQQTFALLALTGGKQVACPLHFRRHLDPAGFEAKLVELRPIELAHLANTGMIHGAAVDVHRLLQLLDRLI